MKGRPPKSVEVHQRDGTFQPSRHSAVPVVVAGREVPPMPRGLSSRAKVCWRTIVADLFPADGRAVGDHADAAAIEAAAEQWALARACRADANKRGALIREHYYTKDGELAETDLKPNPSVRMGRDAWTLFLRYAEQLGMTQSARARLGAAAAPRTPGDAMRDKIGAPPRLKAVR